MAEITNSHENMLTGRINDALSIQEEILTWKPKCDQGEEANNKPTLACSSGGGKLKNHFGILLHSILFWWGMMVLLWHCFKPA